jgi:hypothetical protein
VSHWFTLPYVLALDVGSFWLFPRMGGGSIHVIGFSAASEVLLAMTRLNVAEWICGVACEALPGRDLPGHCAGGA